MKCVSEKTSKDAWIVKIIVTHNKHYTFDFFFLNNLLNLLLIPVFDETKTIRYYVLGP